MINASLQAIKAFEAAARLGSFKEAAEEMSITPAGVSHHISNLEQRIGVQLFTRKNRKITMTAEGQQLSLATTDGLQKIQIALDNIRQDASRINIDTTSSFAALVLIPCLYDFHQAYPDIDVEVSTGEALNARTNALSIRMGDVSLIDESTLLKKERFNLYATPAFIRSKSNKGLATVFLARWKNKKLPDSPWAEWLAENGNCLQEYELRHFDQELYGIYEALAGRGLVFCSDTLVSEFVEAETLQPIARRSIESALCYYLPTEGWQHSVKMQTFVGWLKDNIN